MATIQDVFNYVMHTPGNTNPAVLLSLLNNLETDKEDKVPLEEGAPPEDDKVE